jgi:hypothetical protein
MIKNILIEVNDQENIALIDSIYSKLLKDSSFHQPITENLLLHLTDNMIFYLGDSTV